MNSIATCELILRNLFQELDAIKSFHFFTNGNFFYSYRFNRKFVNMVKTGRLFRAHGEFCASHPWEVIVALITFTACMFSVDKGSSSSNSDPLMPNEPSVKPLCHGWRESCDGFEAQYIAADVILMTIVRCSAVLYCYYQFCNLHKLGSKYILGE